MPQMTEWQQCATLLAHHNTTPETTVDDTFRVIEVFDTVSGVLNIIPSIEDGTITIPKPGTYSISVQMVYEGNNKNFEMYIFKDGVQTQLGSEDRGGGDIGFNINVHFPEENTVIDIRQRSTNGGDSLVIDNAAISVRRLA